jgi:hypothetical protein
VTELVDQAQLSLATVPTKATLVVETDPVGIGSVRINTEE